MNKSDVNAIGKNVGGQDLKDLSYKEVVIIGNGPSGISLSYFLAGNLPYWKSKDISSHPDELLRARLSFLDDEKSLIEHDLYALAQGLEGRTTNPVSLLFDNLQHPGADLGLKMPSMLKYKYYKDKEIDHIVLGKGKPGGSWHRMDPNLRTLSLSTWMSLPNLNFDEWLSHQHYDDHLKDEKFRRKNCSEAISDEVKTRALVQHVADYYTDYVRVMKLSKFFRNDTIVVSVKQIKDNEKNKFFNAKWIVHGFDRVTKRPFTIACNKVVLANGGSDLVNRLGVKGENMSLSWLKYELPLLESSIYDIKDDEKAKVKPVLIVGAGLSAADAIIACRNAGLKVIHVYRGVAAGFMGLPEAYFPEYNMVYRMMRNAREKYDLYQALPESTLKEIKTLSGQRHMVTVQQSNHEDVTFEVSICAIFIGTRPDLSFLTNIKGQFINQNNVKNIGDENNIIYSDSFNENFLIRSLRRLKIFCEKCRHLNLCFGNRYLLNSLIEQDSKKENSYECEEFLINDFQKSQLDDSGVGFGDDPEKAIDCKNNPIAVNKFTNELLHVPDIFALGPLVGDNFVRFIFGGALSISSYLMRNKLDVIE